MVPDMGSLTPTYQHLLRELDNRSGLLESPEFTGLEPDLQTAKLRESYERIQAASRALNPDPPERLAHFIQRGSLENARLWLRSHAGDSSR